MREPFGQPRGEIAERGVRSETKSKPVIARLCVESSPVRRLGRSLRANCMSRLELHQCRFGPTGGAVRAAGGVCSRIGRCPGRANPGIVSSSRESLDLRNLANKL